MDSNDYKLAIAKGTGLTYAVTNQTVFNASNVVFIVGCLSMTNNNSVTTAGLPGDTVAMWVNPDPSTYGKAVAPAPNCATNTGSSDPEMGGLPTGVDRFSWRGTSTGVQHEVDELRIGFTWASVTPPPPVSLAVQTSGPNVVVSWPTNAVGWILAGTTNLTVLFSNWPAATPIIVQGTNNTFTVPAMTGQQFYELTR
jgi:hypothetical protein